MDHDPARAVLQAARRTVRAADAPLLLAVSGGLDSMVMLHAMATVARARIAAVATLDHGTGRAATIAVERVAEAAAALGLPVVIGRLDAPGFREADWRRERYRFLRRLAAEHVAQIVTAHTEDDHVETVLMRVLRGSGTRGLAALCAPSNVLRPFVTLRRATLAEYARDAGVRWVEDPSNRSPHHLRNRVRHDLLPALRRADPSIDVSLLGIARRAAAWRASVESFVDEHVSPQSLGETREALGVPAKELAGYDEDSLAVLWGALAGRVGLALDRRGTRRLATFTSSMPKEGSVPLSGGWCLEVRGGSYILQRRARAHLVPATLPARGSLEWGGFRFRVATFEGAVSASSSFDGWYASFAPTARPVVRSWRAGDRLGAAGTQPPRRVKRYLSDAGVRGLDRAGWPVVVAGDDVVWIPGVRRSDAATERSGRPVRYYICERIDR